MIRIFAAIVLIFSTPSAQAAFDFDGCFQLYLPNVMYPAICLSGTTEEGINGAGVRLAVFGPNTDQVIACATSSALGGSADSLEFIRNGQPELILKNVKMENGVFEGDALLGRNELRFLKIDPATSMRLMNNFYAEERCQGLALGELKDLR